MSYNNIAKNLVMIRQRVTAAQNTSATLIAVSKTQPLEAIEAALAAGQRHFGENRVQEALAKFPALKERYPDLVLHLIGPLQTNKVKEAVALFDVIHTLDRSKLAETLAKEMQKTGRRPQCFVEVNTGEEVRKAGVAPQEAEAFVRYCREELKLPVVGLMCIPPVNEPPAPHFAFLALLAARLELPYLSMGMSGDFESALKLGATHVRVGTAIFGERLSHAQSEPQ